MRAGLKARLLSFVFGLVFLNSCATPISYVSEKYRSSGKIAILPLVNESNDLDGPVYVRQLIEKGILSRGFQIVQTDQVDQNLKEKGFTNGGQLRATTPQKIGEWTGADSLLYCTLEDFNYINVGFYAQRRVKIIARLVDARTGERLWESEREGTTRIIAANRKQAEQEFAIQLAIKAAEKLAHQPLQLESNMAVHRLLDSLPYR